jgi:hypothetical protein
MKAYINAAINVGKYNGFQLGVADENVLPLNHLTEEDSSFYLIEEDSNNILIEE